MVSKLRLSCERIVASYWVVKLQAALDSEAQCCIHASKVTGRCAGNYNKILEPDIDCTQVSLLLSVYIQSVI